MAEHCALRGTRGAAGKEDGSRGIRIHFSGGRRSVRRGTAREDAGRCSFSKSLEFVADEKGLQIEADTAAGYGGGRKAGRQHQSRITSRSNGQEQFDGIGAVAVENADIGAFLQPEALDKGAAMCHSFTELLVGISIDLV